MLKQCPQCTKHIEENYLRFHIEQKHTEAGQTRQKEFGRMGPVMQKRLKLFRQQYDVPVRYTMNDLLPKFEQSLIRGPGRNRSGKKLWK